MADESGKPTTSEYSVAPEGYHERFVVITDNPDVQATVDGSYADALAKGKELVDNKKSKASFFAVNKHFVKDS